MKVKCHNCNVDVEIDNINLAYHVMGRQGTCPNCKIKLVLVHRINPVRNRPKHVSKKQRLKDRKVSKELWV